MDFEARVQLSFSQGLLPLLKPILYQLTDEMKVLQIKELCNEAQYVFALLISLVAFLSSVRFPVNADTPSVMRC